MSLYIIHRFNDAIQAWKCTVQKVEKVEWKYNEVIFARALDQLLEKRRKALVRFSLRFALILSQLLPHDGRV